MVSLSNHPSIQRNLALRALLALLLACHCPPTPPARPPPSRTPYGKIDVHTHFPPQAVDHLIELMDRYGIQIAVNLSGQAPGQGLEEQLEAAARFPRRILVFVTLDWEEAVKGPGYGERMARQVQRAHDLGAVGLKIPKGLGLGYVNWTGTLVRVDEAEIDPIFEKAGALGMPVAIHVGDPVAFWQPTTPQNERYEELLAHPDWSNYGIHAPSWESLFAALERRIARHPKTTFISVHFGNAAEYPDRVAALLDKYPNLYIDTSARIPEMGRHDAVKMRAFFKRYADRILFGSDLGVGPKPWELILGSSGTRPPTPTDIDHFFAATWRYFETSDKAFAHPTPIQGKWKIDGIDLPSEILKKIYAENAGRLLRRPPKRVTPDG